MNDDFQSQFVQITNCSKPNLQQINQNVFAATDRYLKIRESKSDSKRPNFKYKEESKRDYPNKFSPVKTNNYAVKMNKPIYYCVLCIAYVMNSITHVLKGCDKYLSAKDKISKLDALQYCSLCSFKNHSKVNCRFKFSTPCRYCNEKHLTYLTISHFSSTYSSSSFNTDNIILLSFTLEVLNDGVGIVARALYDTGSQRNFVQESIAQKLKLPVMQTNVPITIHGFNCEKTIVTCIVELPVAVEKEILQLQAIVIPSIDINLKIRNLKLIVEECKLKGYLLADTFLGDSDEISSFDIVMGADALKVLKPQSFLLGEGSSSSALLKSDKGLLLIGESSCLLQNLQKSANLSKSVPDCSGILVEKSKKCTVQPLVNNNINLLSSTVSVQDVNGDVVQSKLKKASEDILEIYSDKLLNYDKNEISEFDETNTQIINYVISNTERAEDGRLIMPLPWNPNCKHLLAQNFNLSKQILYSNQKKLQKDEKIKLYDNVFKEQESLGIIERINNVNAYINSHPDCSFLPHMGIFKLNRETNKVRVVYLSNLSEPNQNQTKTVSHNNALLPGPCLNHKLSTSVLLSRFDEYIIIFDLVKAFLNIQLREADQNKLLCLWFRSVEKGDFSSIAYKNVRLPFGLRSSPSMLMLALFKILILDVANESDTLVSLKMLIFNNIYMDNGLISASDKKTLTKFYHLLPGIFENYKFSLQQFATNDLDLQASIDEKFECSSESVVKFFGMQWNRVNDTLGPIPIKLNNEAKSKREVLSSLNAVFDILNIYGPMLNRAKLFLQKIQADKSIDWDTNLSSELQAEWRLICKQANSTPPIQVPRFVGSRQSNYTLVAYSDASAAIYGVVIYIIDNETGKVSFLMAKNKVINSNLAKRSIPSLECQGVHLAVETLFDICTELGEDRNDLAVNFTNLLVYTDSMVTLFWIRSYFETYEKMQMRSTYVLNRLKQIGEMCESKPVTFRYIAGRENFADYISRPISYNKLKLLTITVVQSSWVIWKNSQISR